MLRDGVITAATITIDTEEPLGRERVRPFGHRGIRESEAGGVRTGESSSGRRYARHEAWAPRYWTGRLTWRKETTEPN